MIKKKKSSKKKSSSYSICTEDGYILPADSKLSKDKTWWVSSTGKKLKRHLIRIPCSATRVGFNRLNQVETVHKFLERHKRRAKILSEQLSSMIIAVLGDKEEETWLTTDPSLKFMNVFTISNKAQSWLSYDKGTSTSRSNKEIIHKEAQAPYLELPKNIKEIFDVQDRCSRLYARLYKIEHFLFCLLAVKLQHSQHKPEQNKHIQFKINDVNFIMVGNGHSWSVVDSNAHNISFQDLEYKERK